MFESFRKRRAIKSFIRKVGPALEQRHGRKPHYTPDEVRGAAAGAGVMNQWIPYAFAIYCLQDAFTQDPSLSGANYGDLRKEVADSHFHGDTSFDAGTAIDAADAGSSHGGDAGGDAGGGDAGGGFDSGGGGFDGGGGGD